MAMKSDITKGLAAGELKVWEKRQQFDFKEHVSTALLSSSVLNRKGQS